MARPKLINIHSTKTDNGGLPTADQIEYGELAVNYATNNVSISLKNSGNVIKAFKLKDAENLHLVAASVVNKAWDNIEKVNQVLEDLLYTDKTLS